MKICYFIDRIAHREIGQLVKRVIALGTVLFFGAVSLTGCNAAGIQTDTEQQDSTSTTEETQVTVANTDPRNGWVEVFIGAGNQREDKPQNIFKRCDGTTLVYIADGFYTDVADGITVIADSPECVR